MKTKQVHYISGLVLLVFISLHLFNHLYSVLGAEKHIDLMNALRLFYRNIFIESILLVAVLVQITSGLRLFARKRKIAQTSFEKLHIWSGLYLAFFLLLHVTVVMTGRYLLHLDTNIYFGSAGLNTYPLYFIFVPYYGLAIMAIFGHFAAIHNYKMKSVVLGLLPKQQARGILLFGMLVAILIFYGLTNHFKGLTIPSTYNVLIFK